MSYYTSAPENKVIETIVAYTEVADSLSRRPTVSDLWIQGCLETVSCPDGVTTSELAERLGSDYSRMRTVLPGMVALGMAEEAGFAYRDSRPATRYQPKPSLESFAAGYNNWRLGILVDMLSSELEEADARVIEETALACFATARQAELVAAGPDLEAISQTLDLHRETVRFRGLDGFMAAYGGLSTLVNWKRNQLIKEWKAIKPNVDD